MKRNVLSKKIIGITITFFGIVLPAGAANTLEKIRATQTITIAHRDSSVPFSYLDANKQPVAFKRHFNSGISRRPVASSPTASPDLAA